MPFDTIRDIIELIELRFEYFKTKAQRESLHTITYLAVRLAILLIMTMFIFMISVAAGFMVGELLGKYYFGFMIIAGFYLLIGLTLIFYRQRLGKYLFNKIFESRLEIFRIDQYTLDLDTLPKENENGCQTIIRREDATDQKQI